MAVSVIKNIHEKSFQIYGIITANADNILKCGAYRCVGSSISGLPATDCELLVFPTEGNSVCQFCILANASVQVRMHWSAGSGDWTSWKTL